MVHLPNILITGTPGTGKTEMCKSVCESIEETYKLKHIKVGELVKEHECYDSVDETYDTLMVNDDKLLDVLEPLVSEGGCVVDFHSCELFPERWFDLVVVLRAETSVLFDRLSERNYSEKKRTENLECEIMQTCLEEAMESYDANIVQELPNNTLEDLESNVERIMSWYNARVNVLNSLKN